MNLTLRRSHIPAGVDDEAELVDEILLEVAMLLLDVATLLGKEDANDDALVVALAEEDMVELIVNVADVRVIVEVVVTIAFADEDSAEDDPAIEELAELLAEEPNDEDVRLVAKEEALGFVFPVLDVDKVLALGIVLVVLVPDKVVRLVDIVEDNKMLVEDDGPVLSELELPVRTIELVEEENIAPEDVLELMDDDKALLEVESGVLEGTIELLAALELCVNILNALDEVVDVEGMIEMEVVPGPSD
jgi:hypothetical protein